MSLVRTRKEIGEVKAVLCYRVGLPPENMRPIPTDERGIGCGEFFFDGKNVHFNETQAKYRKFIVYESVEQLQRTTRGTATVRLTP